jgi:hypothetical protein
MKKKRKTKHPKIGPEFALVSKIECLRIGKRRRTEKNAGRIFLGSV